MNAPTSPIILLDAVRRAKQQRAAEASLAEFAKQAWPVLEPSSELKWGWALDAICDHLMAVSDEDIFRLLMNVPPGPMRHDSQVETSRGVVALSTVKVGDKVLTHRGRYCEVEAVHDQGILPILKITTQSGRVTHAAPTHPYLTPTGWTKASDLRPGDQVAIVLPEVLDRQDTNISAEASRLLGYMVGDGCLTQATPMFSNNDADVIEDFKHCCEVLGFKVSEATTKKKTTVLRILGGAAVHEFFQQFGIMWKSSYEKRIPSQVLSSTAECIANFLGAYWSCDGNFAVKATTKRGSQFSASCATVNEALAYDIQQAMAALRIVGRVRHRTRLLETAAQPGGVYHYYMVHVTYERDIFKLARLPGLSARKQALAGQCRPGFTDILTADEVVSIEAQEPAWCLCLTVAEDHSFTCSGLAVKNSMKSLLTGVLWPAWEWGPLNAQGMRYLSTAHKQDLAVRDNLKCRRLIMSPWFQERWPVKITGDQNAKTKFENDRTGFREAMPFTSMTGSRGDRVILDDPLSVDGARSEAELAAVEATFREALPTRVNNDKSAIIVIMQRLHERDPSGIILNERLGYEHLCIPMRFESARRCTTSIGFVDPRTEDGELFFPERFPENDVRMLEKSLGEYGTAGQLQQRPSPAKGGILKVAEHIQLWPTGQELPVFDYVLQSYDCAFSEKTMNDPTACSVYGSFTHRGRRGVMILDAWSDHLSYPQLRQKAVDEWHAIYGKQGTRKGKKSDAVLVEAKASGQSLLQDLRQANIPAIPYNPGNADKVNRAHQAAPVLELDCIWVPESGKEPGKPVSWVRPMLEQLAKFPNDEHDDYVDTFTQAIIRLRDMGYFELSAADLDVVEEQDYRALKAAKTNPYAA